MYFSYSFPTHDRRDIGLYEEAWLGSLFGLSNILNLAAFHATGNTFSSKHWFIKLHTCLRLASEHWLRMSYVMQSSPGADPFFVSLRSSHICATSIGSIVMTFDFVFASSSISLSIRLLKGISNIGFSSVWKTVLRCRANS